MFVQRLFLIMYCPVCEQYYWLVTHAPNNPNELKSLLNTSVRCCDECVDLKLKELGHDTAQD